MTRDTSTTTTVDARPRDEATDTAYTDYFYDIAIHGYGRVRSTVVGPVARSAPHVRHRGDRVFSGWTLGLVSLRCT